MPGVSGDTFKFAIRYVELQLYAIMANQIPSMTLKPSSLNYYSLLGPEGSGYGQFTYVLDDLILLPRQFVQIVYKLSKSQDKPHIDI